MLLMKIYLIKIDSLRAVVSAPTPEDAILLLASHPSHKIEKSIFFEQEIIPEPIGLADPGISRVIATQKL